MQLERSAGTANIVDVLDRVLDKGIVVDAWVRIAVVGIEIVTVEARVIVASIATYLGYAESLADARGTAMAAAQTRIADLERLIPPHNGRPEL